MTNYKKIQKIIHDEIESWSHIKPNSITNNIMKQLDDANLISKQPIVGVLGFNPDEADKLRTSDFPVIAEGEAVYRKVSVKERLPMNDDWTFVYKDYTETGGKSNKLEVSYYRNGKWVGMENTVTHWLEETTLPLSVNMPSDEEITKYLFNNQYTTVESRAIGSFTAWLRSQITLSKGGSEVKEFKREIEDLAHWKKAMLELWNPIIEYVHANRERFGLKVGDSVSEFVLKQLKGGLDAGKVEELMKWIDANYLGAIPIFRIKEKLTSLIEGK